MQLPKLTPLQSRLLASAVATCLLVVIWISFQPHHFVYAAELPIAPEDVQHSQFGQSIPPAPPDGSLISAEDSMGEEGVDGGYAPDFAYFDRSLIGRQQQEVEKLTNSQAMEMDANPGTTKYFVLEKSQLRARTLLADSLHARGLENASESGTGQIEVIREEGEAVEDDMRDELKRRQAGNTVWISANTCRQPTPDVALITGDVPQLTLYVSTKNTKPGPDSTNDLLTDPISFKEGFANFTLQTTSDVFIGVSAPSLPQGWNGSWHFEVAASVDGYYHSYDNATQFIYLVDTDSESALFITYNLSASNSSDQFDKWSQSPLPFTLYAFPDGTWSPMMGLENSFCGLKEQFNATNNITVSSSVTKKFGLNYPKGQFHVQNLKSNTGYTGFLAVNGSAQDLQLPDGGTVRGGGQVFQKFTWTTKADDSCQVIYDLNFCEDVAYAVPSSPQFKPNMTRLKDLYDQQANSYYQNFSNSLDQVACNTTSTAQYSLARNCTDCRNDYKAWLCSVLIPRCEDWNATQDWLHDRNINTPFADGSIPYASNMSLEFNNTRRNRFAYNQSRNPMIDLEIKPGPYKELLPCEDLCFDIVRSCPAQLGFSCPNGLAGQMSYGRKDPWNLTCNFPGAIVKLNQVMGGAGALTARVAPVVSVVTLAGLMLWL